MLEKGISEFINYLPTEMSHTKLNNKPKNDLLGLSQEILLKWYDEMLLIRRFEEKCAQLYGMGKFEVFAISTMVRKLLRQDPLLQLRRTITL